MSENALFQLGMDLDTPSTAQTEVALPSGRLHAGDGAKDPLVKNDHFMTRNGVRCAGAHLIIDLKNASRLNEIDHIEAAMRRCVEAAGATLLHIHLHPFEPDGVSGVAVLAESHISVHTWPDQGYAAFDVFMCGDTKPELCVDILTAAFSAGDVDVREVLRGEGL